MGAGGTTRCGGKRAARIKQETTRTALWLAEAVSPGRETTHQGEQLQSKPVFGMGGRGQGHQYTVGGPRHTTVVTAWRTCWALLEVLEATKALPGLNCRSGQVGRHSPPWRRNTVHGLRLLSAAAAVACVDCRTLLSRMLVLRTCTDLHSHSPSHNPHVDAMQDKTRQSNSHAGSNRLRCCCHS